MASVGTFTVDKNNIRDIVNNTTQLVEKISEGIKDQGADVGEAIGLFITVVLYITLIVLVIGILFLIFRFVKSLIGKARGLGKTN